LNDPAGKGAYPIVTCTWLLISEHYHDAKSAESLRDFVRWCLTKGQDECEPLGYIPLAPAAIVAARQTVDSLIQ
jgi:phosphate transport system substrate-binding protein